MGNESWRVHILKTAPAMKERKIVAKDEPKVDVDIKYSQLGAATDFVVSFALSGLLAIVFKTIIAPLERIKLILQTQASSHQIGTANRSAYSGVLDALVRIPKEQGFLSFWRGNLLSICRYFPAQAINFSFYDIYYNIFKKIIQSKTDREQIILPFLTGGAVGMTTCILFFPFNFCNTRLSADVGDNKVVKRDFVNVRECMSKVYRNNGIRGFYQGVSIMALGMFIYRSSYFGIYTISKQTYLNADVSDSRIHSVRTSFLVSFALAQLSSFTGTMIAYPLDTIGRQKMFWSGHGLKNTMTMRQVISRIIERDGPFGFYKGIFANLLTNICGSFVLVTYDIIKGHYYQRTEPKVVTNIRRPLRRIDDQ